jgi:hypothetical protein
VDPSFHSAANPIRLNAVATGDHIIPNLPPVLDQGQLGSCAANAGCGALEIILNNEGSLKLLSRLHLYWIARALDGSLGIDAGTYIRSIVQQMHRIGVCLEDLWPYLSPETNFLVPPPLEADVRASENRISGYYKIATTGTQRLSDIATAIRANHPVIFGTQVGKAFFNTDGKSPIVMDPNDTEGGHATCLMGVQSIAGRLSFRDKNSWSTAWADGGYCWLDQDYITWGNTDDIWVLTRMAPLAQAA